jgi:hypothetical protein
MHNPPSAGLNRCALPVLHSVKNLLPALPASLLPVTLALALAACAPVTRTSHDPLSIARAPVAAAIHDYQRCANDALAPLKDNPAASVFTLADAALAACAPAHDAVRRSILADNAGHPYVAAFADEASENVRLRTRNMLAHSVNVHARPQRRKPRQQSNQAKTRQRSVQALHEARRVRNRNTAEPALPGCRCCHPDGGSGYTQ